jgi:sugar-specific transcriptional regulator TrmB
MDYRELVNLGLSEKEAKVYIASLELGNSTVQNIAEKAKVNRATTYTIIESLSEKGLISTFVEGKKQYYCAEQPEKLNMLFREQQLEIQMKQEKLEKLLPELKSLNSSNDGPVVRYYEGKEGMRAMAEEFFVANHTEEARMIYSNDLLKNIFSAQELSFLANKRRGKNIKVRSIVCSDKVDLSADAKRIAISPKKYPVTADIAFFDDKIRIASQKGKLAGIIIENKEISNTFKILFDLAWKYLEKNKGDK